MQELQDDVDRICEWISSNHLTINVAKSKLMCISRSRSSKLRFTILVNGSPMEKMKCLQVPELRGLKSRMSSAYTSKVAPLILVC